MKKNSYLHKIFFSGILVMTVFLSLFYLVPFAFAEGTTVQQTLAYNDLGLGQSAAVSGVDYIEKDPYELTGYIINIVLSFLGVIFLIIVIYSGFMWMTASGNTEKISTAKAMLLNALIGFIIVSLAYIITQNVFSIVNDAGITAPADNTPAN